MLDFNGNDDHLVTEIYQVAKAKIHETQHYTDFGDTIGEFDHLTGLGVSARHLSLCLWGLCRRRNGGSIGALW